MVTAYIGPLQYGWVKHKPILRVISSLIYYSPYRGEKSSTNLSTNSFTLVHGVILTSLHTPANAHTSKAVMLGMIKKYPSIQ